MPATLWHLSTPAERAGAIGIIQVRGDIEGAFARLSIAPVGVGEMKLRDLAGVDRGVVARVLPDLALLMPHGGQEIIRQLGEALGWAGLLHDRQASAVSRFPEARSPFEAELLDGLARAASPRAVDLLLDQPRRWAEYGIPAPDLDTEAPDPAQSRQLDRLIMPPLVVAVGASNIGKSTLLNRLCGRVVAATADEPGTTRDHVGSLVEVDGLVVRFVDTPGVRADAPASERAAAELAAECVAKADLVLCLSDCGGNGRGGGEWLGAEKPAPLSLGGGRPMPRPGAAGVIPTLRVALRADLGKPGWECALAVSAKTGLGMAELTVRMRQVLVSDAALGSPIPWRFWPEQHPGTRRASGATL